MSSPKLEIPHLKGSGRYDQDVVGEEHYQEALICIAGPYTKEGRRIRCEAVLYLQQDNPHDRNAIRVEIDGSTVGYIRREQAPILRRQLQRLGIMDGQRATVNAAIGGGRIGTRYGVYLDFDVPYDPQDYATPEKPTAAAPITQPTPIAKPQPAGSNLTSSVAWGYKPLEPARHRGHGFNWWWAIVMILVVLVASAVGGWYARAPQPAPAGSLRLHTPTPDPAATPTPTRSHIPLVTLSCADCLAAGMPANIWKTPQLDTVTCRLAWGQRVERLDHSPVNGGVTKVRGDNCVGWIRSSLVR